MWYICCWFIYFGVIRVMVSFILWKKYWFMWLLDERRRQSRHPRSDGAADCYNSQSFFFFLIKKKKKNCFKIYFDFFSEYWLSVYSVYLGWSSYDTECSLLSLSCCKPRLRTIRPYVYINYQILLLYHN
jgi:hypothetical protein